MWSIVVHCSLQECATFFHRWSLVTSLYIVGTGTPVLDTVLDHCGWCAQSIRVFLVMSDKYRLLVWSLPNSPVIMPIPNLAKKNTPHPNDDCNSNFPHYLSEIQFHGKLMPIAISRMWSLSPSEADTYEGLSIFLSPCFQALWVFGM